MYACLCVGGEDPIKMHFMHYLSISDISCFMGLFKSSQVNRKREQGESRSEKHAKQEASATCKYAPSFIFCLSYPFVSFFLFHWVASLSHLWMLSPKKFEQFCDKKGRTQENERRKRI